MHNRWTNLAESGPNMGPHCEIGARNLGPKFSAKKKLPQILSILIKEKINQHKQTPFQSQIQPDLDNNFLKTTDQRFGCNVLVSYTLVLVVAPVSPAHT